jgi:hypothetical protein
MNLTEAIYWGKIRGLSEIEIARAISWKAGTVYELLNRYGVVDHVEKRNMTSLPHISNVIIQTLEKHGLSFEKWANGWEFDLNESIEQLGWTVNTQNPISMAVHRALNRDMPDEYLKIYREEVTSFKSPAYTRKIDRHTYSTEWDPDINKYKCKVVGWESGSDAPIGIDYKPERAMDALLKALKQERQVQSIQKAVTMLAESDCCQIAAQKTHVNPEI